MTSGGGENTVDRPTYAMVQEVNTGHGEVIKINFGSKIISYRELLKIFYTIHDPTIANRQRNDIGPQYRSLILYRNSTQFKSAEDVISRFATKLWSLGL